MMKSDETTENFIFSCRKSIGKLKLDMHEIQSVVINYLGENDLLTKLNQVIIGTNLNIDAILKQYDVIVRTIIEIKENTNQISDELDSAKKYAQELENEKAQYNKNISSFKSVISEQKQQIENLHSELISYKKEIAEFMKNEEKLKAENEKIFILRNELQAEIDKKEILEIENSTLTSDLESITKKYLQIVNKIIPENLELNRLREGGDQISDSNSEIKMKNMQSQQNPQNLRNLQNSQNLQNFQNLQNSHNQKKSKQKDRSKDKDSEKDILIKENSELISYVETNLRENDHEKEEQKAEEVKLINKGKFKFQFSTSNDDPSSEGFRKEIQNTKDLIERLSAEINSNILSSDNWDSKINTYFDSNLFENACLDIIMILKEVLASFLIYIEKNNIIMNNIIKENSKSIHETTKNISPFIQEKENNNQNLFAEKEFNQLKQINFEEIKYSPIPYSNFISAPLSVDKDIQNLKPFTEKEFNTKKVELMKKNIGSINTNSNTNPKFNNNSQRLKADFVSYSKNRTDYFDPYIQYGGRSILTSLAKTSEPRRTGCIKKKILKNTQSSNRIMNSKEMIQNYPDRIKLKWKNTKEFFHFNDDLADRLPSPDKITTVKK